MKNKNWILALMIMLFVSATIFQQNVYPYLTKFRGGISVGDDSVSGTNIGDIDSIGIIAGQLYAFSGGDTLDFYVPFSFREEIGDVAVLKHPTALTKTATDTLVLTEDNNYIYMNGSSADTLWIDTNANQAFTLQSGVTVYDISAQDMYIAPLAGVTLNGASSAIQISAQYKAVVLIYYGTNTWLTLGAI